MGKNKKKATDRGDSDDALLEAAMAQAAAERTKLETEAKLKAKSNLAAQLAASQLGIKEAMEPQLRVADVVERLDAVPTFAIMNESTTDGSKRFVPMAFPDDLEGDPESAPHVCAFFLDPKEAKSALVQAQKLRPELTLVLGAMPLGHAFGLTVGWAEAVGTHPFTIRGSPPLTRDTRDHIKAGLDKAGLPSYWQIPVILCEALHSPTVMPVFFTHDVYAPHGLKHPQAFSTPRR